MLEVKLGLDAGVKGGLLLKIKALNNHMYFIVT